MQGSFLGVGEVPILPRNGFVFLGVSEEMSTTAIELYKFNTL